MGLCVSNVGDFDGADDGAVYVGFLVGVNVSFVGDTDGVIESFM